MGRLVLKNIPMLGELTVFKAHDVSGDPRCRTTVTGKAPMGDDVVRFGEDQVIFVAQSAGKAANKIE